MAAASHEAYEALFGGQLKGLLQWQQFDALWTRLREQPEGWFVRDFSDRSIPEHPAQAAEFLTFLDEAESFLRRRHREDYCGFIYLDAVENPTFIKVFDPRKMGSACACSSNVKPRWTISRARPVLAADLAPPERPERKSILARLFGG